MKTPSEVAKERRERLKNLGLCITCGKNPSKETAQRCVGCQLKQDARTKKWRKTNKEHYYFIKNKSSRKRRHEKRIQLLKKYGGKCTCCGETELKFLQVDHIDKDGFIHRKTTWNICADLLRNPGGYNVRILCANCHNAITYYGGCPHETVSSEAKISYTAERARLL